MSALIFEHLPDGRVCSEFDGLLIEVFPIVANNARLPQGICD